MKGREVLLDAGDKLPRYVDVMCHKLEVYVKWCQKNGAD